MPGTAPGAETHMTIEAKWLGACEAGQKPGDVMMSNGMKMNVLDLPKTGRRAAAAAIALIVIPGRRFSAGPGIQMQSLSLLLDSGFAGESPRPGMTNR